jgi:hypothetical protein
MFGRKSQSLSTCQPHFGRETGACGWVLARFFTDITAARREAVMIQGLLIPQALSSSPNECLKRTYIGAEQP